MHVTQSPPPLAFDTPIPPRLLYSGMKSKPAKKRLDQLLVERGLAESTTKAQAMILAGEVSVDDVRASKAGSRFSNTPASR